MAYHSGGMRRKQGRRECPRGGRRAAGASVAPCVAREDERDSAAFSAEKVL